MENNDVRWIQRFNNYKKAFTKLSEAVKEYQEEGMSDIEKEGLIQRFEYTYELAWNTMKDFYENQGETNIQGSRDAIRTAISRGLISSGEIWMKMIESRIQTSHTYDENIANTVVEKIVDLYFDLFSELKIRLEGEIYGKPTTLFSE